MLSAYTVPEYIGWPGSQKVPEGLNNKERQLFEQDMLRRFQIAYLRPMTTKPSKDANVYDGEDAWDEYVASLNYNGISIINDRRELSVILSAISPIGETYQNDYENSSILSGLTDSLGSNFSELTQIFGVTDTKTLIDSLSKGDGVMSSVASAVKGLGEGISGALDKVSDNATYKNIKNSVTKALINPQNKIDFPKFWKGSKYSCSYELQIRLYCYNVQDDAYYTSYILSAYAALMQFVLPRSNDGNLYTWPFLLELRIPGVVHLPLCYASNVSVIKGGEPNMFSNAYRPNIIDLKMTISPLFDVMYNIAPFIRKEVGSDGTVTYTKSTVNQAAAKLADGSSTKWRPTLLHELNVLNQKRVFDGELYPIEDTGLNSMSDITSLGQDIANSTYNVIDSGRSELTEAEQEASDYFNSDGTISPE